MNSLKKGIDEPRLKIIRNDIGRCFDAVDGFLLREKGDRLYEQYFNGSIGFLNPDFSEALQEFAESNLSPKNLITKKMKGKTITVANYCDHFQFFTEFFSRNVLPVAL